MKILDGLKRLLTISNPTKEHGVIKKDINNMKNNIIENTSKKVKEVTNYNDENAWDGADADTGTYFYVVLFNQEGIEPKNGTVQLLR